MKALSVLAAGLVVCVGTVALAQEGAKPAKGRRARRAAMSPEQQMKRLEKGLERARVQAKQIDGMAGKLTSPEGQAAAKEAQEACAATIKAMEEQLETLKSGGQPARGKGSAFAMQARMGGARQLLGYYAQKEAAQNAQANAADEKAKAAAGTMLGLCEKLIANHKEITRLQAEQRELQRSLQKARRDLGGPKKERAKRDRPRRKKKKQQEADEL